MPFFKDRLSAGRRLAGELSGLKEESPWVLGMPPGGMPVAAGLAQALGAELGVLVVRPIETPDTPPLEVGAATEDGFSWVDHGDLDNLGLSAERIHPRITQAVHEVEEVVRKFRGGAALKGLHGRVVVLVDDGLVTGTKAIVGARYLRSQGVDQIILAMPVAPLSQIRAISSHFDRVVVLERTEKVHPMAALYEESETPDDAKIHELLDASAGKPAPSVAESREVRMMIGAATLEGSLTIPEDPRGLVLFAHGSGSSRLSPRNRAVAAHLVKQGMGTLLFDLLTPEEAHSRDLVFDIPLLARRLERATRWIQDEGSSLLPRSDLPIGFFGASTGAAAALLAAAELGSSVAAVVSRGGRPDLAEERLAEVHCPVLLVVGGADTEVLALNQQVLARLQASRLEVIPGATHLFEEAGALEQVAELAAGFFLRSFRRAAHRAA